VHLITVKETHTHTHARGRTPLDESLVRRRNAYPYNT